MLIGIQLSCELARQLMITRQNDSKRISSFFVRDETVKERGTSHHQKVQSLYVS
jgi:hypothetical protein